MLGDTYVYRNRRIKCYRNRHRAARIVMATSSNDLRLIPPILRDETEIDFGKSIDNVHRNMLQRNRILGSSQLKLRVLIDETLAGVNNFIKPNAITLPDLRDSSSDSAGSGPVESESDVSSSASDSAESTSPDQQSHSPAENDGQNVDVNPVLPHDDFIELEPESNTPDTLLQGTPEFLKYADQIREDMLGIFTLASSNFRNHKDAKFAFARLLRAAGVWRRRDFNEIIVPA